MPDDTDLPALAAAVPEAMLPALRRLREDWHRRLRPADAVERATADAIVAQSWRLGRLDALEERVMVALIEGRPDSALPSLATVLRARNRLEKDRRAAEAELEALRSARPAELEPAPETAPAPEPVIEPIAAEIGAPRPSRPAAPEPRDAGLDAAAWPADEDDWLESETDGTAEGDGEPHEPATEAAIANARRLPPELEEVLAGMWRSAGWPARAPERRLAIGS